MVVLPANPIIARAFGGVVIISDTALGPASYDDTGTRFVFVPAAGDLGRYAVDVESRVTAVPPLLSRLLAQDRPFFEAWTSYEVVAKLTDMPILSLVKSEISLHILSKEIAIIRRDTPRYWVTIGRCAK